jgi:hypothetical protein
LKTAKKSGEPVPAKEGVTEAQPPATAAKTVIKVNGERMTPEVLRELISKNPDKVTSALRNWSSFK